ncbi:MAG TPA: rhomboid family intramembrane serine protease [Phenylobacterium sp.]|nr:rhomboid family intramembrane serine protease [Phenylobacterium sp.]
MSESDEPSSSTKEPIFNAPWPVAAIALIIVGGFFLQTLVPPEQVLPRWAFSPAALGEGRFETLFTSLFLHGSWAHALMNAAFGLAFAAPVVRYFGTAPRGLLAFALFYLGCGAIGNLGFAALHAGDTSLVVGASGAVSGLTAAASRIAGGRGEVGPLTSPLVVGMGLGILIANILIAILGFAPGAGGAQVAWEAHLAGFAAGLFLVAPLGRIAGHVRVN